MCVCVLCAISHNLRYLFGAFASFSAEIISEVSLSVPQILTSMPHADVGALLLSPSRSRVLFSFFDNFIFICILFAVNSISSHSPLSVRSFSRSSGILSDMLFLNEFRFAFFCIYLVLPATE